MLSSPQMYSWLTSRCRSWFDHSPARSARPRCSRLRIEGLEDRLVPSLSTLVSGLSNPIGVAVDGSGNVYIADTNNNAIKEWVKSSNTVTTLVSAGLYAPYGVAVDGSGNVYFSDTGHNAIKEWVATSQTVTTLVSSGLNFPEGVAVDGSGNVYFADYNNHAIKEWVASSQTVTTLVSSGISGPFGVAVDGSGNVYFSDFPNNAIKEWVASSQTVTTLVSSGLAGPYGVAVDGSGNVYIVDSGHSVIKERVASSQTVTTLVSSGLNFPVGVAVDGSGNVYIADYFDDAIKEFVPPPSITMQPQNATATVGQAAPVSFSVSARGAGQLSYQWQISTDNGQTFTNLSDSSGISGSLTAQLTLSSFAAAGSAEYQVIVTDGSSATVTSNAATLTINAAPMITTQPQNATATVGQSASASFTIAASGGTGSLAVRWQISMNNGGSFTNLSDGGGVGGSGTTSLTISSFATAGSPEYRAVVTDANGVTATSNAATLTVNAAPTFTTQPASQSATTGQTASASFRVAIANGTGPLTYQWQVSTNGGNTFSNVNNGSGISGATTATLTISSSALPVLGTKYQVVVTDANGVTATSTAATLTINAAPSITTQPQDATATVGQSASETLTITESGGTGPLSVQWQVSTDNGGTFTNLSDGGGVGGSGTTSLTISIFAVAGSPEYRAVVTDANGVTATSNAATLTVNAAPSITTQPENATATVGQSVTVSFTIAASGGTGPLGVHWQISSDNGTTFTNLSDGSDVAGATTTILTLSNFPAAGSAEYRAIITDLNGVIATSNAASLTINAAATPTDPNQSWLTRVYADLFHRPLDPSGFTTWNNLLNQGLSRTQVVALIQTSLEYRADVVEALYANLLHRAADASGLDAFTSFLGAGGTAQQVEAAILGSAEYFALHGGSKDSFLDAVYQDVFNRALDDSGAQTWGMALAGGGSRAAVVGAILASVESYRDDVQSFFSEFLHRPADSSGLNSFTAALQQGVAGEVAVASIIGSEEYFAQSQ